jgi:hypothetical protein
MKNSTKATSAARAPTERAREVLIYTVARRPAGSAGDEPPRFQLTRPCASRYANKAATGLEGAPSEYFLG